MNDILINKTLCDILNRYSKVTINNTPFYIKHFNSFDQLEIDEYKELKFKQGLKSGLLKESEKLAQLKSSNIWTKEDQEEEDAARYNLQGSQLTRKNLFIPSQIKQCEDDIRTFEKELNQKLAYKEELLGLTAEKHAERLSGYFYLSKSLYFDVGCQQAFLDKEKLDGLEEEEINDIIQSLNNGINHISQDNIKKTALSVSFQNLYNLNSNPYYFFGYPTTQLTFFQISLFSFGSYYSGILKEMGEIDDSIRNSPEKLESLFIGNRNREKEKARFAGKGGTVEFMGDGHEPTERDYIESKMLSEQGFGVMEAINTKIF